MKKGKRLITLFAILLVLVVGATSLVACTDKKGKKMSAEDFANMLNNGVEMAVSPSDGWYFNVDAKVSVAIEKDGAKTKYDLIVRGTLDTKPEAQDKHDNQIFLQLNETKGDAATTTLLGLYYSEKECDTIDTYAKDAPQLYIELGGKYKFAYDTYSIKKLIRDVTPAKPAPANVSPAADEGIDIGETIKGLVPTIFEQLAVPKTYKIKKIDKNTVQTSVNLDITRLLRASVEFEDTDEKGNPNGKIVTREGLLHSFLADEEMAKMIDGVLGKDGLDLDLTADKLLNLDIQMPMTLTCQYESAEKGSFGKFKNAALNINIEKDHDITIKMGEEYLVSGDKANNPIIPFPTLIPKCNLTIAVEKMEIASAEKLNIEFPSFKSFKKIGIANIDISGKVRFKDDANPTVVKSTKDLIIKADINPIPLAFITSDTDVKQKVFEAIGMLHIAIIDEPDVRGERANALLEIAYDPNSSGGDYAYVNLNVGILQAQLRMDASSLEGLFNVMVDFVQGKYPKTAPAAAGILDTVADGDINNVAPDLGVLIKDLCNETIKSIVDMIDPKLWDKDIDGNPATEDSVGATIKKIGKIVADLTAAENGAVKLGTVNRQGQDNAFVELNLKRILDTVGGAFGLDKTLLGTIQGLIPQLLGGDMLNIEFTGISYGTVPKDYDAIQYMKKGLNGINADRVTAKIDGIKDVTGIEKISKAAFKAKYATLGKKISLNCTAINGKKFVSSDYGVFFATYDATAPAGIQTVTVAVQNQDVKAGIGTIVKVVNMIAPTLKLDKFPLGFESYTFQVEFID